MAKVSISFEIYIDRLIDAVKRSNLSDEQKQRFACEWRALEDAGAEMIDCGYLGGRIVAHPSEDFTAFCAKWGIHP